MQLSSWLSFAVFSVIAGLSVALVVWQVRSRLRKRRRARFLAELSTKYRQHRAALAASKPPIPGPPACKVMVYELVARIEAEGRAVRLNWDEQDDDEGFGSDEDEWPTVVLPSQT